MVWKPLTPNKGANAYGSYDRYPAKRILVHFLQPHVPSIGEIGQRIDERGMSDFDNVICGGGTDLKMKVWTQREEGEVDVELVRRVYREILDIVLSYAEFVCEDLWGKPISNYGHLPRITTKRPVQVPRVVVESESRREITAEPTVQSELTPDREGRLEQLSALGYR